MKKLWPFLILLIPIIIFFAPVIFSGKLPLPADTIPGLYHPMRDALADQYPNGPPYKNFLITDSIRQQYPYRQFSIETLKSGQLPWWNPYNFAGQPHIANFQSATFYPLNFIYWLTDFTTGWSLQVISQPLLGAFFLYLYLRHQKLTPAASIFAAITWIFSGFFIAWLEWNTAVHVAIWTPLILLSIDQIIKHQKHIYLIPLIFGLTSQVFAGYPQPWIYLSILQFSYLIFRFIHTKRYQTIPKFFLAYLIFAAIASIQLIPTLQFAPLTNRDFDQGGIEYHLTRPDWFIPYPNLIQLIVPDFFGNPATLNYWGVFNYTEFVSFIGIIPLIFFLTSISASKKTNTTKFFIFSLLIALTFALKNPLSVFLLKANFPFISNSQPSRLIVVIDLSLAILAAFGFDHFLKQPKQARAGLIITSATIISLWLLLATARLLPLPPLTDNWTISFRNTILPTAELFLAITTISALILFPKSQKLKLSATIILITFTGLSGLRFARKFTPFANSEFLYPQSTILTYLQNNQELFRYATTDNRILVPNINLAYRLYTIEGYDPMYSLDYGRLVSATDHDHIPDKSRPFNRHVLTDQFHSPIIDILGVVYILSLEEIVHPKLELIMEEGQTKLYQNQAVFPRAFVTSIDDPFRLTQNDLTPAQITSYSPNQVTITTSLDTSAKLILTDAWHPDWQATDNQTPIPVLNWHGLRAIELNQGDHEIIFFYHHPQLQWL